MDVFKRLVDWFIPDVVHNDERLKREAYIIAVTLLSVLILNVLFALLIESFDLIKAESRGLQFLLLFFVFLIYGGLLFFLKFKGAVRVTTHIIIFSGLAMLVLVTCLSGGLISPQIQLLLFIPVLAIVLIDSPKAHLGWMLAAVVAYFAFFIADKMGIQFQQVIWPDDRVPDANAYHWLLMTIVVFSAMEAYSLSNDKLQKKLAFQMRHDSLTDLPNRIFFREYLEAGIRRADRTGTKLALFYIDLDRFKPVNDQYGHHVGDEVLVQVAERLRSTVRVSDTVARLGGDEFALICELVDSEEDIENIAMKLIDEISKPILIHGKAMSITCSIGISIFPDHAKNIDTLNLFSDAAMYRAKQEQGKFFIHGTRP